MSTVELGTPDEWKDFKEEALADTSAHVVYFTASWCGPCKMAKKLDKSSNGITQKAIVSTIYINRKIRSIVTLSENLQLFGFE